jgi:endo-1,4-beta-xylanase
MAEYENIRTGRHCTDTFEGEGAANVLDENYAVKPAFDALRQDLLLAADRH